MIIRLKQTDDSYLLVHMFVFLNDSLTCHFYVAASALSSLLFDLDNLQLMESEFEGLELIGLLLERIFIIIYIGSLSDCCVASDES